MRWQSVFNRHSGSYVIYLSQILGVAAQRGDYRNAEARQQKIERRDFYSDSTTERTAISRIMNDAEGIRNSSARVGQILGSIVTETISVGVLFWINWQLTRRQL